MVVDEMSQRSVPGRQAAGHPARGARLSQGIRLANMADAGDVDGGVEILAIKPEAGTTRRRESHKAGSYSPTKRSAPRSRTQA